MTCSRTSPRNDDLSNSDNSQLLGRDIQFDVFARGVPNGPPSVNASAAAVAMLDVDLQGLRPSDHASVSIGITDVINLNAWGQGPLSASSTATLSEQGSIVITNQSLSGNAQTGIIEDVTAFLPASHVSVHLHITDSFDLRLSGQGYTAATLQEASASSTVVQLTSTNGPTGNPVGTFDLARFAAVVLGTTRWDISFAGSIPGESLQAEGHSIRVVDAEADILASLPGSAVLRHFVFHDVDDINFSFNSRSGPAVTGHSLPHDIAPVSIATHSEGLRLG